MAARSHTKSAATYIVDNKFTLDSSDHQDHTFCGIMFDVRVLPEAPVTQLLVTDLSVRGGLGRVKVYVTKDHESHSKVYTQSSKWEEVYSGNLSSSWRQYKNLVFERPVQIEKGEIRGFYIHSQEHGDASIVYDNQRFSGSSKGNTDQNISILPGMAHLSPVPFSSTGGFGWGGTWRTRREFVGRIGYGTRQILWKKANHELFPFTWRQCASAFYMCHATSWSGLPADVVEYILNMCSWDWFDGAVGKSGGLLSRGVSAIMRRASTSSATTEEKSGDCYDDDSTTVTTASRRASTTCTIV